MGRRCAFLLLLPLLASCGQGGSPGGNQEAGAANVASPRGESDRRTLAVTLAAEPRLVTLVEAAGMTPVLEGREPYTILAPSAEALDALPPGTIERLQKPEGRAELTAILRRHILPGTITRADLLTALRNGGGKATIASMAGEPLSLSMDGETIRIGDSEGAGAVLVGTETLASNGVVHRIDQMLPAPVPTS
jgi:uncharacterized surface protein with fasciclin (FAS1) repeats